MANTFSSLYYHIIFSTKNRVAYVRSDIEQRIWAYIGGVARKHRMTAIEIGGADDHVHTLVLAPTTLAPADMAQFLKGDSSKWIHDEFSDLKDFGWQDGIRRFHRKQIKRSGSSPLYQKSARASPEKIVSGRILGISEQA